MRRSISAQSWASVPPAPALMVKMQLSWSHSWDNRHSISMALILSSKSVIRVVISDVMSGSLGVSLNSSSPVSVFSMAVLMVWMLSRCRLSWLSFWKVCWAESLLSQKLSSSISASICRICSFRDVSSKIVSEQVKPIFNLFKLLDEFLHYFSRMLHPWFSTSSLAFFHFISWVSPSFSMVIRSFRPRLFDSVEVALDEGLLRE